nr:hypothetical protein CFP56_11905 [Quercus suber]
MRSNWHFSMGVSLYTLTCRALLSTAKPANTELARFHPLLSPTTFQQLAFLWISLGTVVALARRLGGGSSSAERAIRACISDNTFLFSVLRKIACIPSVCTPRHSYPSYPAGIVTSTPGTPCEQVKCRALSKLKYMMGQQLA